MFYIFLCFIFTFDMRTPIVKGFHDTYSFINFLGAPRLREKWRLKFKKPSQNWK
ncbi:hypothetical protein RchiOBHm_Chr2g0146091 [Rosa chinensis]|uniref:Uncharacterized protein n=1 Tax=Rosa chinensis TaxID=74649 RepID=A0A2P6RYS3_ROSCH|nr:hypothetical protein RchiOBHm_Chr2g0146091 [Rosa chinensis]